MSWLPVARIVCADELSPTLMVGESHQHIICIHTFTLSYVDVKMYGSPRAPYSLIESSYHGATRHTAKGIGCTNVPWEVRIRQSLSPSAQESTIIGIVAESRVVPTNRSNPPGTLPR